MGSDGGEVSGWVSITSWPLQKQTKVKPGVTNLQQAMCHF